MTQLFEGVGIALQSIRANKGRAALTILGIAIGVMVVMVIASMVRGINRGVTDIFERLGPRTFFVFRHFEEGISVDDDGRRRSPWLTVNEANRLEQMPSVNFVVVDNGTSRRVEFGSRKLSSVGVRGRGTEWPRVSGGDIYPGRSFTELEHRANARVAVINEKLATELFGQRDPIGREITIAGVPFEVIGVHNPPPDLFGRGNRPRAIVPHGTLRKYIPHWRGNLDFLISPASDVTVQEAMDDVTATLRAIRRLRPADENNFAVVTQDKLLENWNNVTRMFFVVMIALSAVGLMVGGVGVIAVMMISVTERTREIGVRKAIGATRREILWQFLVEAGTLTLVGGAIGMVFGGLITFLIDWLSPLPASVPLWAIVLALGASALTGIGFGLYPASRAARLDPVEALRYE